MKLTVVGCSGGYPSPGGATSGYLLEANNNRILIDCGSGVIGALPQDVGPLDIDAVILSHLHYDHMADMLVMAYALQMNRAYGRNVKPLCVYCPDTPETIFSLLSDHPMFDVHTINSEKIDLFGVCFSFYKTRHPVTCFALRIEYQDQIIAYTADSLYDPSLLPALMHADLAILDCGSLERDETDQRKHMTPKDCYELYSGSGAKRLVLSHIIPYHSKSEIKSEADRLGVWPYGIACQGQVYDLSIM